MLSFRLVGVFGFCWVDLAVGASLVVVVGFDLLRRWVCCVWLFCILCRLGVC